MAKSIDDLKQIPALQKLWANDCRDLMKYKTVKATAGSNRTVYNHIANFLNECTYPLDKISVTDFFLLSDFQLARYIMKLIDYYTEKSNGSSGTIEQYLNNLMLVLCSNHKMVQLGLLNKTKMLNLKLKEQNLVM